MFIQAKNSIFPVEQVAEFRLTSVTNSSTRKTMMVAGLTSGEDVRLVWVENREEFRNSVEKILFFNQTVSHVAIVTTESLFGEDAA